MKENMSLMTIEVPNDEFPPIPEPLLEALKSRFKDTCPNPHMTDREIWMAVGQQQVIRFLDSVYKEQSENLLRNHNVSSS
ncbi:MULTISPECIES: hypothetical protein [unclassified Thioalkalivibrio]|uniref:hypothetical protein n=1 Tax=unclassified Thioalkalivibrio TaxID=2621013 RepID=UPI000380756F|nr:MULTISPECIES: hypothetical protein [unclassified Thioalkalivibrio]